MAGSMVRRPLPALVALLALLLLTALVWWRVLHRDGGGAAAAQPCPSTSTSRSAVAPRVLPQPASINVLVLNATSRNGIAAATRKALVADGFRSPQKASNDLSKRKATVTGVAQIRYGASSMQAAMLVQYYFPRAQLVATGGNDSTVTISLGPKYRKTASKAAVRAAMAADGTSLSRGTPTPSPSASTSSCAG